MRPFLTLLVTSALSLPAQATVLSHAVRIGFGTHGNPRYEGFFEHLEMQLMVESGGMTPMQVIQPYSKANSEALGVDKEYGTLAKGKAADLVVLDKSPLDNILNTRSINAVYLAGKKHQ